MAWGQSAPVKNMRKERAVIARAYFDYALSFLQKEGDYFLSWDAAAYLAEEVYEREYNDLEPKDQRLISGVTRQFSLDAIIKKEMVKLPTMTRQRSVCTRDRNWDTFHEWIDAHPSFGVDEDSEVYSHTADKDHLDDLLERHKGVTFRSMSVPAHIAKKISEGIADGGYVVLVKKLEGSGTEKPIRWTPDWRAGEDA